MFKPKFNKGDIEKYINQQKMLFVNECIGLVQYAGESFINHARNNGAYKDQTGNLRSSIGYVILYNGKIVSDNFLKFGEGGVTQQEKVSNKLKRVESGMDGITQAKNLLDAIAKEYPVGIVLIACAGMHYAAAVESKNFDVITTSSITAGNDLKKAINDLQKKINKR